MGKSRVGLIYGFEQAFSHALSNLIYCSHKILFIASFNKNNPHSFLVMPCDFMHHTILNTVGCKYIKYACGLTHRFTALSVRVGCWLGFDWQRA